MSEIKKAGRDWVVKSVNTPVVKTEMVPYLMHAKEHGLDTSEVETFCKENDIRIEDFYFLKDHAFSPYCYWDNVCFQSFASLDQGFLSWDAMSASFVQRIEKCHRMVEKKQYDMLLTLTETIGQHLVFESVYAAIPNEERYEIFMDMYVDHDYGFSTFPKELVQDAFSHQKRSERNRAMKKLKERVEVKDGKIVVYRGMGDESTPVEQAMSWTTSEKTAYFFANRLGTEGKVVKGEVKLEHIIDYITRRSEEEVIILPGHVEITESEEMVSTEEEMRSIEESGLIGEYQAMRNYFIKEEYYQSPYGDHGVSHVKRVLLHCISLANAIGLDDTERGILMLAACYHDIGRKHDDACLEHGKWSLEKMNELGLDTFYILQDGMGGVYPEYLSPIELETVEFLIHYHCKPDEDGERAMKDIDDELVKEYVEKLFPIFKDADALDRVRISDLNLKYLRTKEARQRVKFAEDVFLFVK